jgi:type I restriction enzyme S subunit
MGQEWERLAYGSTHMTIYMPDLESLRIPLPPVEEQRRISDFLESETARLDALAGARQAQIRCLEELWKSRLAHRVDELIGTYGLVPMRRLVNSVEQGWSPQCDDVQADPSEWAVLKTSAVSSGEFMPLEHKKLPADLVPDARYSVAEGDLLMTRGSGSPVHVGVSAVAHPGGRRLLFSDLLYRVRMAEGWLPEFTALVLQSEPIRGFMALLFRGQSGQTIKLRADDIRAIPLPNVPPRVQNEHTAALTEERQALSSAVAALRKSSALLAERRTALITAAVTGQFDVSTASGRGIED